MGWGKGNSPQQQSPHSCNIPLFSMKTKETVQHLSGWYLRPFEATCCNTTV